MIFERMGLGKYKGNVDARSCGTFEDNKSQDFKLTYIIIYPDKKSVGVIYLFFNGAI